MLATFIIGLREGLEAALIVGIIAAFLRKNGRNLGVMWLGVGLALALSLMVGVGLDLVEKSLPQAAQEGMETIIGAIAVFFVTGMIFWMSKHARSMKQELEAQASEALTHKGAFALAIMAFLAVLKEGFETAVFLLAVLSVAQSALLAAIGAVLGVLVSVIIGWGIYVGGVRLNLSKFFRATGAFLILVAAGLVLSALRTAHEAGWLNGGQQPVLNLAWLVAPGTVQSALISGILGIPADPRLIEVIGWLAYLVPVMLIVYWPSARRLSPRGNTQLRLAIGVCFMLAAAGLAAFYPKAQLHLPSPAPLSNGGTAQLQPDAQGGATLHLSGSQGGAANVILPAGQAQPQEHQGVQAIGWTINQSLTPASRPATLSLDELVGLVGRVPVGMNVQLHPGPYQANWVVQTTINVWAVNNVLLDATQQGVTLLTLSGSGLSVPRVVSVRGDGTAQYSWNVTPAYAAQAAAAVSSLPAAQQERHLWALQFPMVLAIAGLVLISSALRRRKVESQIQRSQTSVEV